MNRPACALVVCLASGISFTAGCGGGSYMAPPPPSNPVPAITSVNPSSVIEGSAATPVTINGSGFISSSLVQWNGTSIDTAYTSATSLSATIPPNDLANASIANITVVNPAPGGGTSQAVNFSVGN